MRILIACEESQAVCKEFREKGHDAYSCDILPCSGGHPEWHIQDDVRNHLNKGWDMIIAFPPCTDLAVSGARYFKEKRADGRQQKAIEFYMTIAYADCQKIAIENPVGIMSTVWRKPDQYIQPWEHGHEETKKTGLHLKNLPLLKPTKVMSVRNKNLTPSGQNKLPPSADRARLRGLTYLGIAKAMAEQWSQ